MKSISNRKLTLLRKLQQKKYRIQEQLFIVEGKRAVQQVFESNRLKVAELYFNEAEACWAEQPWSMLQQNFSSSTMTEENFIEISDTDNPQGVMALCRMPRELRVEELAKQEGLIVATDAIQDPGNLGTILRTAGWFGALGLLAGKGTVDLFHPKVVRSTAGSTGMVPFTNVVLSDVFSVFEKRGWQVVLLDVGADAKHLQDISKTEKMIIVIGNEANGISSSLFNPGRIKARIPSPRADVHVESLNAAIALSIALYAFHK